MRTVSTPPAAPLRDYVTSFGLSRTPPLLRSQQSLLSDWWWKRNFAGKRKFLTMACASPITVCPVCLDNLVDARVLPCLHSVCKTCVDKMLVTATDGNVKCPTCQATVTIPSGRAASLPEDVTVVRQPAKMAKVENVHFVRTKKRRRRLGARSVI